MTVDSIDGMLIFVVGMQNFEKRFVDLRLIRKSEFDFLDKISGMIEFRLSLGHVGVVVWIIIDVGVVVVWNIVHVWIDNGSLILIGLDFSFWRGLRRKVSLIRIDSKSWREKIVETKNQIWMPFEQLFNSFDNSWSINTFDEKKN